MCLIRTGAGDSAHTTFAGDSCYLRVEPGYETSLGQVSAQASMAQFTWSSGVTLTVLPMSSSSSAAASAGRPPSRNA